LPSPLAPSTASGLFLAETAVSVSLALMRMTVKEMLNEVAKNQASEPWR
jgi:hypothetical protein